MRYLITGGAGFIGSHLAQSMVARGDHVMLLDNFSTGRMSNIEHLLLGPNASAIECETGSASDLPRVQRLVDRADTVVHLAASVGVQLIVEQPMESLLNNIRTTEAVLTAAAADGTKVLVASSSEIYGKNGAGPLREDSDRILGSPFKARWAYSTSKAVEEILAHQYWREREVPTVVVRLFNCAGPRQTGAYGMVIPRFVRQALTGEDLTIFGPGTQSRCFCHVSDTVEALLLLLESDQAVGEVYNVGAHNETQIKSLAERIIELTGSSSTTRFVPYDEAYEPGFEDMERRLPDVTKIRRVTGWAPSRSLDEIITDVIAYETEQLAAATA